MLETLHLLDFEPNGFYAELLAAIARRDRKVGPDWALREQILRDERAWRRWPRMFVTM